MLENYVRDLRAILERLRRKHLRFWAGASVPGRARNVQFPLRSHLNREKVATFPSPAGLSTRRVSGVPEWMTSFR